jgi:geranylgeranyl diphosphate synthase type I
MPVVIDLPGMLAELITTGGKRLRPILAFLGFRAGGGPEGAAAEAELIKLSAALELLHSFALVHDDVMDESTSRRGRPTAHVGMAQVHRELGGAGRSDRFGESIAVLLGDLAHAEADRLIAECPPEIRSRWHTMIIELINGQVRDLAGAAGRHRDPRQALLVAQLKSGAYTIQRPLELGAAAAGADPAVLAVLSEYGHEVGSAFALRDDVLGVWGDPAVTGKPSGDDLVAGKPTVIIALAEQRLPRPGRVLLGRIGTSELSTADVGVLQRMIDECGVRAEVETMIDQHIGRALAALHSLDPGARSVIDPDSSEDRGTIGLMVRLAHHVGWRDR